MNRTVNRARAIENTPLNIFVTLLTVLILVRAAQAGIVDSPVPNLGPGTAVRYSVSGVINTLGLGTYFSCTSTAPASQQVAVELFDAPGGSPVNDAIATQSTLAPGATVLIGSQEANGLFIDNNLNVAVIHKGSARILSTSKSLICTAFVADANSGPSPASMVSLTIVTKVKQKGE